MTRVTGILIRVPILLILCLSVQVLKAEDVKTSDSTSATVQKESTVKPVNDASTGFIEDPSAKIMDASASTPPLELKASREKPFGIRTALIVSFGVLPLASLELVIDRYYIFASVPIALPVGFEIFTPSAGTGFDVPLIGNWYLNIFWIASYFYATDLFIQEGSFILSVGLGVGIRYEFDSSFVVALKVPLIGYGFNLDVGNSEYLIDTALASFYASFFFGMPMLSFGYRF